MTILLTHTPEMRRSYYGEKALAGLTAVGAVRFHERATPLDAPGLIAAANVCDEAVPLAGPFSPPMTEPAYACNGKFNLDEPR